MISCNRALWSDNLFVPEVGFRPDDLRLIPLRNIHSAAVARRGGPTPQGNVLNTCAFVCNKKHTHTHTHTPAHAHTLEGVRPLGTADAVERVHPSLELVQRAVVHLRGKYVIVCVCVCARARGQFRCTSCGARRG